MEHVVWRFLQFFSQNFRQRHRLKAAISLARGADKREASSRHLLAFASAQAIKLKLIGETPGALLLNQELDQHFIFEMQGHRIVAFGMYPWQAHI